MIAVSGNVKASPRTFLIQKSQAMGRLDPFFYRPELVELEQKIFAITHYRLRDFVERMAGGATPLKSEAETHYTEDDTGIPFIRVQNLSTTGKLDFDDIKKIARSTHERLLLRSKLTGGELLVKITGVGRMAVSSVVPDGLEANINQHIVAIHTKDKRTSEALAAYLNLDIIERLASRRATGGTRPALDYPALLSIPVIFDERIPKLMLDAVTRYESKQSEAAKLLQSIDDILLKELGIFTVPNVSKSVADRIFSRSFSGLAGRRIDPPANQEQRTKIEQAIHASRYSVKPLWNLIKPIGRITNSFCSDDTYIGLENIDGKNGLYRPTTDKESISSALKFDTDQILFSKLRPYLNKTHLARFKGICSTEFVVFEANGVDAKYVTAFLRSKLIVEMNTMLMTGNTLPRLNMTDLEHLPIPVPPIDIQKDIAGKVDQLIESASSLTSKAQAELDETKTEIEAMLLGKEVRE